MKGAIGWILIVVLFGLGLWIAFTPDPSATP